MQVHGKLTLQVQHSGGRYNLQKIGSGLCLSNKIGTLIQHQSSKMVQFRHSTHPENTNVLDICERTTMHDPTNGTK